eukprot:CAMPEP_0194283974 /NCGR_PEP_ID=MMETSP0169-20130528/26547_1 /TAXON_ID=218684 /ORGANISM="Corethron pennatum, Strain L29A3" /LENGTH=214 /DNA_ID=CAMNT_0039029691 /DNA_START=135 /DNA_END=779 /DNA_ORIENTATION=+
MSSDTAEVPPAPAQTQSTIDQDVQFYASPPNPPDVSDDEPAKGTNSIDNVIPKEKIQKGFKVAGTAIGAAWKWTRTKTDEVGKNINQKLTELPETQVGKTVNRGLAATATGLNTAGQQIARTTSTVTTTVAEKAVVAKDNIVITSKNVGVTVGNVVNDVKKNPTVASATEKIGEVAGNIIRGKAASGDAAPAPSGSEVPAPMESSVTPDDKRVA